MVKMSVDLPVDIPVISPLGPQAQIGEALHAASRTDAWSEGQLAKVVFGWGWREGALKRIEEPETRPGGGSTECRTSPGQSGRRGCGLCAVKSEELGVVWSSSEARHTTHQQRR